jgi:hypothetical protein
VRGAGPRTIVRPRGGAGLSGALIRRTLPSKDPYGETLFSTLRSVHRLRHCNG